ncbi:hypothetical protein QML29_29390, partial [Klebsiella pneumoniae]|uniref:hypothetical protein n=1 Tax=Klebsiella pneumoniae TaxID=573 RepID=UPI003A8C7ECF
MSDSSLDPTLKNNIKSEFVSYPLFNNDKITYQKVDFGVFRHFLNFGKMKIKVVSRESFVKQHVSRDVVKLKFLNCSGHNFDINGFEVCFKRIDKSTLPMMIKCGTFLE